jgi:hypothetical protein
VRVPERMTAVIWMIKMESVREAGDPVLAAQGSEKSHPNLGWLFFRLCSWQG